MLLGSQLHILLKQSPSWKCCLKSVCTQTKLLHTALLLQNVQSQTVFSVTEGLVEDYQDVSRAKMFELPSRLVVWQSSLAVRLKSRGTIEPVYLWTKLGKPNLFCRESLSKEVKALLISLLMLKRLFNRLFSILSIWLMCLLTALKKGTCIRTTLASGPPQ